MIHWPFSLLKSLYNLPCLLSIDTSKVLFRLSVANETVIELYKFGQVPLSSGAGAAVIPSRTSRQNFLPPDQVMKTQLTSCSVMLMGIVVTCQSAWAGTIYVSPDGSNIRRGASAIHAGA